VIKLTGTGQLTSVRTQLTEKKPNLRTVSLCGGTGCRASESEKLLILLNSVFNG